MMVVMMSRMRMMRRMKQVLIESAFIKKPFHKDAFAARVDPYMFLKNCNLTKGLAMQRSMFCCCLLFFLLLFVVVCCDFLLFVVVCCDFLLFVVVCCAVRCCCCCCCCCCC